MGETCRAEYKRPGARDSSLHDRIVRCQLDAGHEGDHEEVDTGNRWPDMELFNRLVDANDADIKSRGELLASRDRRIGELEAKLAEAERERDAARERANEAARLSAAGDPVIPGTLTEPDEFGDRWCCEPCKRLAQAANPMRSHCDLCGAPKTRDCACGRFLCDGCECYCADSRAGQTDEEVRRG